MTNLWQTPGAKIISRPSWGVALPAASSNSKAAWPRLMPQRSSGPRSDISWGSGCYPLLLHLLRRASLVTTYWTNPSKKKQLKKPSFREVLGPNRGSLLVLSFFFVVCFNLCFFFSSFILQSVCHLFLFWGDVLIQILFGSLKKHHFLVAFSFLC